jgi:hypothetical protein
VFLISYLLLFLFKPRRRHRKVLRSKRDKKYDCEATDHETQQQIRRVLRRQRDNLELLRAQ